MTQTNAIGVIGEAAQSVYDVALLGGIAKKRLTDGFRSASVTDVKTASKASGAMADASQPVSNVALLGGAPEKLLKGGVRCASVAVMNSPAVNPYSTGGGLSDFLIGLRPRYGRAGVCDRWLMS